MARAARLYGGDAHSEIQIDERLTSPLEYACEQGNLTRVDGCTQMASLNISLGRRHGSDVDKLVSMVTYRCVSGCSRWAHPQTSARRTIMAPLRC